MSVTRWLALAVIVFAIQYRAFLRIRPSGTLNFVKYLLLVLLGGKLASWSASGGTHCGRRLSIAYWYGRLRHGLACVFKRLHDDAPVALHDLIFNHRH